MFEQLHRKFEKKDTDLYKLQQEEGFSRYILIRSLGNEHLKELIEEHTNEVVTRGNAEELYSKLYSSAATIDEIIEYINTTLMDLNMKHNSKFMILTNVVFPIQPHQSSSKDTSPVMISNQNSQSYNHCRG